MGWKTDASPADTECETYSGLSDKTREGHEGDQRSLLDARIGSRIQQVRFERRG